MLAPYVEKYLAAADDIWERKGTQRASTALEYIFPKQLASQELLDAARPVARESPANPAAKRYVREGRDDVARALAPRPRTPRADAESAQRDTQTTPSRRKEHPDHAESSRDDSAWVRARGRGGCVGCGTAWRAC